MLKLCHGSNSQLWDDIGSAVDSRLHEHQLRHLRGIAGAASAKQANAPVGHTGVINGGNSRLHHVGIQAEQRVIKYAGVQITQLPADGGNGIIRLKMRLFTHQLLQFQKAVL